jgi:hypothetical protein
MMYSQEQDLQSKKGAIGAKLGLRLKAHKVHSQVRVAVAQGEVAEDNIIVAFAQVTFQILLLMENSCCTRPRAPPSIVYV